MRRSRLRQGCRAVVAWLSIALVVALGVAEARTTLTTVQVKDINRTGSTSRSFTPVNDTVFFVVENLKSGSELWAAKPDRHGHLEARLVKDIKPGSKGSYPDELTNVDGVLFFSADDGVQGRELWRSDGTGRGTTIVRDINPGAEGSDPYELTNAGGALLFGADDGEHGSSYGLPGGELWRSDGTATGTTMVRDIQPGPYGSNPAELTSVGRTVFFRAYTAGYGLWKSDGTAAGTTQLPICPSSCNAFPRDLTRVGSLLYFAALGGLWRSDGSDGGTSAISTGLGLSNPRELTDVDGTLFFGAFQDSLGHELWKSDGTAIGTRLVKDIYPGIAYGIYGNNSWPLELTNAGGTLFFTADDSIHGRELWRSDGSSDGTTLVQDIEQGTSSWPYPNSLREVGGALFFATSSGVWRTDSSANGATRFDPEGPWLSGPSIPFAFRGALLFEAETQEHLVALWQIDGTPAGTRRVGDFGPGSDGSVPSELTSFRGKLFFAADDGVHGSSLWRSNGTERRTTRLTDGVQPSELTVVNRTLLFAAGAGNVPELWRSDGTSRGTKPVRDLGPGDVVPKELVTVGNTLFFVTTTGGPSRLWRSDGTERGTVPIATIGYPLESGLYELTNVGGTLFFVAYSALWKTDGTAAGTALVRQFDADEWFSRQFPSELTAVGRTVFFRVWDDVHGSELWKSDGTTAGTVLVKDINPGRASGLVGQHDEEGFFTNNLTAVGDTLFFSADDGIHGNQLWKTDGTEAGTRLVKEIGYGFDIRRGNQFTDIGGTLYFSANGLWKSDGTSNGTVLVSDALGEPYTLTNLNGRLFFGAIAEPLPGYEGDYVPHKYSLWVSDGTAAGTKRVSRAGIVPAPGRWSAPQSSVMEIVNGTVYFAGWDEDPRDVELWKTKPRVR